MDAREARAARRASPALRLGTVDLLPAPEGVVAFRRVLGADCRTVLVNFTAETISCPVTGTVELASDGREKGAPYDGRLGPDVAVILRGG